MQGITKLYPDNGVLANDQVDFEVRQGEIHALVGENGAGKSTLMKVLYGLERCDAGRILLDGREVSIRDPLDATRLGIGMVHQHFRLIPSFSVAENVVMGIEPRRHGCLLDMEAAVQQVEQVVCEYGFAIDPSRKVAQLTVGQMQQVEIVKILFRQARLLILDEPTSVLTEQEVKSLFAILRRLIELGKTIILITHKLAEVKEISDRVTVMRGGRVVAVRETLEVDQRELSRLMVGRSVTFQFARPAMPAVPARTVFELREVCLREKGREQPLLDRVSLRVRAGEIVGIAGVAGNGLGELEDVISGLRRPACGRILHNGEDIAGLDSRRLRARGWAYVPANRLYRGSSLQSSVAENMIICNHHFFLRGGVFDRQRVRQFVSDLTRQYSIGADPRVPMGTLSGGNIQKVILARELAARTDFLIFSEPTWGLDVASSEFIYEKILEIRARGVAVLLLSSNLDEILSLADTVVVMYRGRIAGTLANTRELSKERIGEYMLGLRDDRAAEPSPAGGGGEAVQHGPA
jgi:simple sugar transport system ATP-binding protein